MARLFYPPDLGYGTSAPGNALTNAQGDEFTFYLEFPNVTLADISLTSGGSSIAGSTVEVGSGSLRPGFYGPADGTSVLFDQYGTPVYAITSAQVAAEATARQAADVALAAQVTTETTTRATAVTSEATTRAAADATLTTALAGKQSSLADRSGSALASGTHIVTTADGDATYEMLARDVLTFYVDARLLTAGALAGQTPVIGAGIQSSGQVTTTVASGLISGSPGVGTTYFSPTPALSSTPVVLGADVAFTAADPTYKSMTIINSSDASILVANAIHFNFGPQAFTLTSRKDGTAAFEVLLTGSWREQVPTDGTTVRRYELEISGNTVIVRGPNGEEFSVTDKRVGALAGHLPIWEPNQGAGGNEAYVQCCWAVERNGTQRPSPYMSSWRDAGAGTLIGPNGQATGNRNTVAEVGVGIDSASGLPAVALGPTGQIFGYLAAAATVGQTTVSLSRQYPSGSVITIEGGANTESITTTGTPSGTGPYIHTIAASGTIQLAHAINVPVYSTALPASSRVTMSYNPYNQQFSLPNVAVVIAPGNKLYLGSTLDTIVQRVAAGVTRLDSLATTVTAQTLASNGAVTVGITTGVEAITLQANATSATFAGSGVGGQVKTVEWIQDGTGGRTYVWPALCKFAGGAAPAASTTAGMRDIVTFRSDGTFWRERSRAIGVPA